jgi:glycosyltransferase involved in cell wall biosynthesis
VKESEMREDVCVDILVPCYNAEKYLPQLIESIKAQTYADYRVLFIDDGSSDRSVDIIETYAMQDSRVTLLKNDTNHGVHYTRNRGLKECRAKYIALMDADDEMPKYRLEHQMDFLLKNPECDVVSGNYCLISEEGKRGDLVVFGEWDTDQVYANLFFWDVIANGSAVIKRRFIVEHELQWDENFPSVEDYNFWVDCMLAGANMHIMDEILEYYRVVQTGLSRTNSKPEKLERRNKCFDAIHGKMLDTWSIKLTERERNIYFEYTNEVPKNKQKKLRDFPHFLRLVWKLLKQNPFDTQEFYVAVRKFLKIFYHF